MRIMILILALATTIGARAEVFGETPKQPYTPPTNTLGGESHSQPLIDGTRGAPRVYSPGREPQTLGNPPPSLSLEIPAQLRSRVERAAPAYEALLAGDRNRDGTYSNGIFATSSNPPPRSSAPTGTGPVDPIYSAMSDVFLANRGQFTTLLSAADCGAVQCTALELADDKLYLTTGYAIIQGMIRSEPSRSAKVSLLAGEAINQVVQRLVASHHTPAQIAAALRQPETMGQWLTEKRIVNATLRSQIQAAATSIVESPTFTLRLEANMGLMRAYVSRLQGRR